MPEPSNCSNYAILSSLASSLDRMREAEWHIRMMEEHYHCADHFRWSLNSFLRTLKEVLQLVSMEIQSHSEIVPWFQEEKRKLKAEPLISFLYKQRDDVVHKSMLLPASSGFIGFTRGRGLKLGISSPIDPKDDSETAMLKYIHFAAKEKDFLGILYDEEDGSGEYSCVQREWRLAEFPDNELTELAGQAWEKVSALVMEVAIKLGAKVVPQKIRLGNPDHVRFKTYRPEWIKRQLEEAKKEMAIEN
jgi:hypothetical protein